MEKLCAEQTTHKYNLSFLKVIFRYILHLIAQVYKWCYIVLLLFLHNPTVVLALLVIVVKIVVKSRH